MYKTIVVHVDGSRGSSARLKLSALLAEQQHAHLVVAAMTGISRYVYSGHATLPQHVMRPDLAELATTCAAQILDQHTQLAAAIGVPSYEGRLVTDDAYGGLVLQSRYADLVILGQSDRGDPATGALHQDLPEYVILNGCCPVLVVPFGGHFASIGRTVMVAWDGSMHAARAIALALPLLVSANRVVIAMVDPVVGSDEHGEEPGADIAAHLARHNVQVEALSVRSNGNVGETLLTTANQVHADLLVMGAFGHSRLREIMLGGATRTVLSAATVPILMAR